jgi:hypothetical protein
MQQTRGLSVTRRWQQRPRVDLGSMQQRRPIAVRDAVRCRRARRFAEQACKIELGADQVRRITGGPSFL